ncbi:MAG: FecR family protein [Candidatus Accumulibacter sp.]|uniref:FecR family protein n=1 Tax=Accumulibacter sp. TaxID=2053492 RepID=UPI002878E7DA|nr:FecR family protein [Accumulibacter sp.]MDS4014295.1 FecR family protein [Accumulibacter sp.]
MAIRTLLLKLAMLLALMHVSWCVRAQDAGAFVRFSGSVSIVGADNKVRVASANNKIHSGDTVSTDARSEAVVKMADDSIVALRPNTQFRFTEYRYEEKSSDKSVATLLRGAVRLITGLIGKANNNNVSVQVSTATIGIRGTDFEVVLLEEGSNEGRAGVYSTVNEGATHVKLVSGEEVDVKTNQTAFAPEKPLPGEPPLQLLDSRPVFIRGGAFDSMMRQVTGQSMRAIQNMRR